jgi:hypothetical protein
MFIPLFLSSCLFTLAVCCIYYFEIHVYVSAFFNCRSATVDSSLFARYFGDCPVITVEGRTHPVSTHFLEDVYEKMEYCLALDSPASGAYFAHHGEKVCICSFHIYQPLEPFDYCCSVSITISCMYPHYIII